ncbi:MAG: undecaprenyl-diphosphate phosphatase [Candidatus Obscuribacterales bacterium]|nr:undecaprenyl-diphosphate phosphatase [Candidatus Obscuribacterales bacterium]
MTLEQNSMPVLEAVVLGVVQGLTEFLPISSTAHLRVVPAFLGWSDPGVAYSAVIQLGSVLAVLIYFWKDLVSILQGSFIALKNKDLESHDLRLSAAILVGTIPICILGFILKKFIEAPDGFFRSLLVIGGASIFMGLLLLLAEKIAKKVRGIEDLGVRDGLLVGLGQAIALIPGCSRSGSTLTAALLLDIKREDAARFSFLLGLPAIILSGLLELKDMLEVGVGQSGMLTLAIGLATSAIVSYLAIWWLLKYLQNHSTIVFVAYRLLFGLAVIVLTLNHQIH